jgi:hypothetical protein
MNDVQENKFSSDEAADGVLTAYNAVWKDHRTFPAVVTKFREIKTDIHAIRLVQETPRTGAAVDKQNVRDQLINAVIWVRDGVQAHAAATENNDLLQSVHFTDSDLKTCRDTILADKANVVFTIADPLEEEIGTYFVTRAEIDLVRDLRNDFNTIIAEPRLGIVSTGSATKDLVLKFKERDQILKKMDIMIKPFAKSNKTFVDNYFRARIIVDLGHRKSGTKYAVFEALIRDFETQQPLSGATFTVVETGQSVVTGADGKARVSLKVAGTFTIQVTLEGYTPYNEEGINIQLGNQLNFEIDLEPAE